MNLASRLLLPSLAALACAMTVPAHAQHTACVIEGIAIVNKKPVSTKDCFENYGAEQDDFMIVCEAMEKTAIAVTRRDGSPPPTITYGKTCPAGAVAICKGFMFRAISNYHYPRSARELDTARETCVSQGGEWKRASAP